MHSKNINEDSYQSLKSFRENQIKTNIKFHLLFIFLLSIINIGLIIFIILYKTKLSSIKSKFTQNSSFITNNRNFIDKNNNLINHKFLNMVALCPSNVFRFSLILEKSEEVQKLKNSIYTFYKENKNTILYPDHFVMKFLYHSFLDGDIYPSIEDKINYSPNTFILFEGEEDYKFGFFIEEQIILDKKKEFKYNGNNCFLISFQHDGIFKCIGDKNKFILKDDGNMLTIGDDDIVVKNQFLYYEEKKGIINFPFKGIDVSTINKNIFTPTNEKFHIMNMEIFSFDF